MWARRSRRQARRRLLHIRPRSNPFAGHPSRSKSATHRLTHRNAAAYATSKAAIIKLTENLAAETKRYGITVFSIRASSYQSAFILISFASTCPAGVPGQCDTPGRELVSRGHLNLHH